MQIIGVSWSQDAEIFGVGHKKIQPSSLGSCRNTRLSKHVRQSCFDDGKVDVQFLLDVSGCQVMNGMRVCRIRILRAFLDRNESNELSVQACRIGEDCQELRKGLY